MYIKRLQFYLITPVICMVLKTGCLCGYGSKKNTTEIMTLMKFIHVTICVSDSKHVNGACVTTLN